MPCERCGKQNPADIHTCTPSREYMLEVIQKEISDKTLTFGCRLLRHCNDGFDKTYYIIGPASNNKRWISSHPFGSMDLEFDENMVSKSSGDWYEVIGHPVMIGDVLDYMQSNNLLSECVDLLGIRNNKTKPIQDQSDECISYIYSLLPPEVRK